MAKSSKGSRSGTRRKFRSGVRAKFKVTPYLQEFKPGDRVVIKINPSSHRGLPHPRFKGSVGEVINKRGKGYIVRVRIGNKVKEVITKPEHLVLKSK